MKRRLYGLAAILLLWVTLLAPACSPAPNGQPAAPGSDAHTLALTTPDEPGQPLTIHGQVLAAATQNPVPGAQLYFYHADADGEYDPVDPEDESTARLSGLVTAAEDGRFTLHTIVPREYDVPGNRHIHIHYARADGFQDFGGVILFEDDVNDEIRQWAEETGFGTIIPLQEDQGVMVGDLTIQLVPE